MRPYLLLPAAAFCVLLGTSCTKSSDAGTSATAAPTSVATVAASDAASAAAAVAPTDTPPAAAASPAAASDATGSAGPAPVAVAFTDIAGNFNASAIMVLGQLGVFDSTSGAFHPNDPVKRRDFVRWLFKANNAVYADTAANLFHPGTSDETPAYKDLKTSDPDFQYIQGMSDSGVSVGFPDKTFKGDVPITREQAVSIKALVDSGGVYKGYLGKENIAFAFTRLPQWKDRNAVSVTYRPAMAQDADMEGSTGVNNIGRAFGALAVFKPQKTVSRGEAATMFMVLGAHSTNPAAKRNAAAVLHPSPSP